MRNDWREMSGFGELLCLLLAWAVGLVGVWSDYAMRAKNVAGDRVAASVQRSDSDARLE